MRRRMAILLWLTSCWATVVAQGLTRSGLDPQRFDSVMDGTRTALYTLVNRQGMEACVTNYGARLVSLVVDGKDCVTGFDNVVATMGTALTPDHVESRVPVSCWTAWNTGCKRMGGA